jgi:hypothetical protein
MISRESWRAAEKSFKGRWLADAALKLRKKKLEALKVK